MSRAEALLLTLTFASLLAVGILCTGAAQGAPLPAENSPFCEPVSGVELAYKPDTVQPGTLVSLTATVITGSLPLSYTWAFGDTTDLAVGVTVSSEVTVTHTYTATGLYTVTFTAQNSCTVPAAQQKLTVTVSPAAPPVFRVHLPMTLRETMVLPPPHLGYGANVASADHAISLTVMGFDWAKGFVGWDNVGKGPHYNWAAVDNQLREFVPHIGNVLLRVDGPPPSGVGNPPASPSDLAAFGAFAQALARHVSSTWRKEGLETAAYEIWNEPNLDYEWGGRPDAAQYTALLKVGYAGIKAGDPQAIVVSAGLATTGGSMWDLGLVRRVYQADQVIPDLTFLRSMYENGAKGYLDALGSHPYGGRSAPATPPDEASGPIYFRRAEEQHEVMLAYGDHSPVWATEFGWVLETDCNLGEHEWMEVDEAHQAEYLAGAYAYADANWPWMGPMLMFNLDFGTCTWYDLCDPMRWYSITYRAAPSDPANSPLLARQAFDSLREMPKRSAW